MDIIEALHVVGAIFLVGPVAAVGMYAPRYVRSGDEAVLGLLRRIALGFGIGVAVVGLLGFGLVSGDSGTGWQTWVIVSIGLFVVAVALTLGLLVPTLERAKEPLDEDERAGLARSAMLGGLVPTVLYLVIAVLMVVKPWV